MTTTSSSQSALSILASAHTYLLSESLWNDRSLASSLSNNTTLNFHRVPGHDGLPGNVNADLPAKAGACLHTDAIPCPLPTVIAKMRYFQYHNWRCHISHSYLNYQVPKVSSEELLLSRPIRCELSRLRCHGHCLLLSSYLHRISRKENSACSVCGHSLQNLNHFLLDFPAQGHREGGAGGYNDPGAHGVWGDGPQEGPWARKRPIKISVKSKFFGDHLILTEKTVRISVKTFFFGDHIIIWTKLQFTNRKCVIFQLAPGPRSALGAPGPASEPLRKSIFGCSLSILDLWSRPWGVARLLGLCGVPPRPHPRRGSGSTTTTNIIRIREYDKELRLKLRSINMNC